MAINESVLRRRAMLDARMKTQPQLSALRQQLIDRKAKYRTDVRTANDTGRIMAAFANAQQPTLAAIYDQAAQRAADAQRYANSVAPTAPDPASALQAAIAAEGQRTNQNIAADRASAMVASQADARRALEGAAFGVRNANTSYGADATKIYQSIADTLGQQGDAAASAYAAFLDKAQGQDIAAQNLAERIRHDHATEINAATRAGKSSNSRKGGNLTHNEQNAFIQKVNEALGWVQKFASAGTTGSQVRQFVTSGTKYIASTEKGVNGQPDKTQYANAPGYGPDIARIAMDLYYNSPKPGTAHGSLTATSKRILRNRGVRPPRDWLHRGPIPLGPYNL